MASTLPLGASIIFLDGTCVFCNRLARFILDHDREGRFHFAHIQGEMARGVLRRHGRDPSDVDPIYLLVQAGENDERLLIDGAAGREIWPRLFKLAVVLRIVPLAVLNLSYRLFARVRYRIFGQTESCRVPTTEERQRFLEG